MKRPRRRYEGLVVYTQGGSFGGDLSPGVKGRADYECKIGDMISKKIGKRYVILKSGGTAWKTA